MRAILIFAIAVLFLLGIISVVLIARSLIGFPQKIGKLSTTAQVVGDLSVDWGVAQGSPIFVLSSLSSGYTETKTVKVSNGATSGKPIGVRGVKKSGSGTLEDVLFITISEKG